MIEARQSGAIGWITLNNPARHNALDRDALMALQAAVTQASENLDLRVLVLTGTGKSFCAGAALGDVAENDWTDNPLIPLCAAIEECRVPVICALNGGVYGGGVDIALACDFRIGVQGMRMFVPPAKLGIHYPAEGLARAVRIVGLQIARRVFLRAEVFEGKALVAAGFLDEYVVAAELTSATQAFADDLAGLAPLAVQGMKRTFHELATGVMDPQNVTERIRACYASDDHREGLAAQREKRAPVFHGK